MQPTDPILATPVLVKTDWTVPQQLQTISVPALTVPTRAGWQAVWGTVHLPASIVSIRRVANAWNLILKDSTGEYPLDFFSGTITPPAYILAIGSSLGVGTTLLPALTITGMFREIGPTAVWQIPAADSTFSYPIS